ncbi:hypothetical protein J6590_008827 [Homalodisca vitripennis]|nr:hypothetical protein J6590_008827 [Homalodisca vitripennis]
MNTLTTITGRTRVLGTAIATLSIIDREQGTITVPVTLALVVDRIGLAKLLEEGEIVA